jgi:peptide/nickel transport system permease protein
MSGSYLVTRGIRAIITVLSVTVLLFLLFHAFGPDPALIMAGPKPSPEVVENLRKQFGLDRPLWLQLATHLRDMLSFDLGRSLQTKESIVGIFKERAGPSLSLSIPAFVLAFVVSLVLGLMAAYFANRPIDRLILAGCVLSMSVSALVFIMFGQYVLAFKLGWFEIAGYEPSWSERWYYLALPILIYVVISVGPDVRIYRSVMLEQIRQEYIQVARSKGLSDPAVLMRHLMRNVMIPIVTLVVVQMPFLILGSLLLERFFGIPGLGDLMLTAMTNGDFPIVKALVFFIAVILEGVNIVSDLLYAWLDPRISLGDLARGGGAS